MARASQNPTQTPCDSFHFHFESPRTMGASSLSLSQLLVPLLNQITPNNREPPNQSVTIQSEAYTIANITNLGGFTEIPIQTTSHMPPKSGILTNPSDTSHLSSHTSHNLQQTVSSCPSSGSPHLSQNPSIHTEPPPPGPKSYLWPLITLDLILPSTLQRPLFVSKWAHPISIVHLN